MVVKDISGIIPKVLPVPTALDAEIQHAIDQKTKPLGSLGRIETLAWQIARVQQSVRPSLQTPHILVFAADHGIAAHGVSAYPQDVSWQMVLNILNGGAAISVFSKIQGIGLSVIDVGVNYDFSEMPDKGHGAGLVHAKVSKATADMLHQPAMSFAECNQAILTGQQQVAKLADLGCNVIGFGEMGIANTSATSLLMSRLLNLPLEKCVGRGTGLDDLQLQNKLNLLTKVSVRHADTQTPMAVLAAMGGLEIAAMAGGMLAAANRKLLILVDGFIASAAYLVAWQLQPAIADYAVFCHRSQEIGHQLLLEKLQVQPLLDLGMRLGEGSGCAVAFPLLRSAVTMLNDMASFSDAGVSGSNQD
jgi:nicotinate-nucleotide--dimethylbenzimidazole phosphoribosyltransferase